MCPLVVHPCTQVQCIWAQLLDPHLCTSVNTSAHTGMSVCAHVYGVGNTRLPVTSPPWLPAVCILLPRPGECLPWQNPGRSGGCLCLGLHTASCTYATWAGGGEARPGASIKDHILGLPGSSHQPCVSLLSVNGHAVTCPLPVPSGSGGSMTTRVLEAGRERSGPAPGPRGRGVPLHSW